MKSLIIFIVGFGLVDSIRTEAHQTDRDLSQYDRAGPYTIPYSGPANSKAAARMRDFIWQHWSAKRLGYVTVFYGTAEGNLGPTEYYIEPDYRGSWCVSSHWKVRSKFPGLKATSYSGSEKACDVKRVKISGRSEPFSPNAKLRGQDYRLLLSDTDGKVVREL